jgi:hypothetical protein
LSEIVAQPAMRAALARMSGMIGERRFTATTLPGGLSVPDTDRPLISFDQGAQKIHEEDCGVRLCAVGISAG